MRNLLLLFKPLLYPFSLLYGIIIWLRNRLYDSGFISSVQFSTPVISVGNLSTGGTGKTPHIEYLVRLLHYEYQVATMSRGYKRSTRGFLLASDQTDAVALGDEPLQFFKKFPDTVVCVCEDRMTGIPRLLGERPDVDLILLDDAYQHRSVQPGLNILITDYSRPFYRDFILPFGSLREGRKAYKRADIIIISKCPPDLGDTEQQQMIKAIRPLPGQKIFFTGIRYGQPYPLGPAGIPVMNSGAHVILVCGIARPEPLLKQLQQQVAAVHLLRYPDHHYFTDADLDEILQTYRNWDVANKIIVTTEKDAMRLLAFQEVFSREALPVVVIPIEVFFLNSGPEFDHSVREYIENERTELY